MCCCGYDKCSQTRGGEIMYTFLTIVAGFILNVAEMGAGFLSMGAGYQPDVPEELLR